MLFFGFLNGVLGVQCVMGCDWFEYEVVGEFIFVLGEGVLDVVCFVDCVEVWDWGVVVLQYL